MLRSSKPQPLKIVVLGEAQVGKTCFIDMFLQGKHYIRHPAVDSELLSRTISHQNENWDLCFMDVDPNVSLGPRYQTMVDGYLETADGIIFMYDITQGYSFDNVIAEPYLHTWYCRNTIFNKHPVTRKLVGSKKRFGCVLVGNKTDVVSEDATKRQVHTGTAEQWAASQGMRHFEVTANERGDVEVVVQALIDSILRARRMDARDAGARVKPSRASSNDSDARSVLSLFKRATKR